MAISLEVLKDEIIGEQTLITTPFGERLLTYADYTASGRSVKFIEKYLLDLQRYYANSHTEDSATGKHMTSLVHKAEEKIKHLLGASDHYLFTTGTGATGAIHKFSEILGIYYPPKFDKYVAFDKEAITNRPVIFISAYEHHSNELLWRESLAEVVTIGLTEDGHFDLEDLRVKVSNEKYNGRLKIGSFSAASNITGILSPVYEIAKIMHDYNGYACFDFAASGPYVEINMSKDDTSYFDAVYLSPHKFIGGPSSSGVLALHKSLYEETLRPTVAGGGTVDYVSRFGYDFVTRVEERERAGTPGILQILRTALVLDLKENIGIKQIHDIEQSHIKRVMSKVSKHENIEFLGNQTTNQRLAILSFNIKYERKILHHHFVAKLLNDLFGIQARAGCACAGPYGHALLDIKDDRSMAYRAVIHEGIQALKPGWVRLNFHYTMTEEEVDYICEAMRFIADKGYLFLEDYEMDYHTGLWSHKTNEPSLEIVESFGIETSFKLKDEVVFSEMKQDRSTLQEQYLTEAIALAEKRSIEPGTFKTFENSTHEALKWYPITDYHI
jgi:selenocysteine lyase/cysteine desulfurase